VPRRANIRPEEPGRGRILAAGRELFADRGYHATSIADIGERAGISKSVIYHHFGSKGELYEAILRTDIRELVAGVAATVPEGAGDARLGPGIDAYLSFLESHRTSWRLLLRDPPADPRLRRVHARLAQELRAALRELLARPDKRAAAGTHVELVATAIRTFTDWWYEHPEIPRAEVVNAIRDVAGAGARRFS
jgi:AcrR family transcriptional regulator